MLRPQPLSRNFFTPGMMLRLGGVVLLGVLAVALIFQFKPPTDTEPNNGPSDLPEGRAKTQPETSGGADRVVAGATVVGLRFLTVEEPEKPPDKAPLLIANRLASVRDGRPVLSWRENIDEDYTYNYVLYEAHRTPAKAFAKSARHDLVYAHLYQEPKKYRGEVVHVEGRLKRLFRFDPPLTAAEAGVPHLYEGWIFTEGTVTHPVCVVFTELPEGLKPGERLDRQVAFDGYFFKRFRYEVDDGRQTKKTREAPLLIGHSPVMLDAVPATADWSWPDFLLPVFIGGLLVVIVGLWVGLTWWFRRGDRLVRSRLDALAVQNFNFVEPDDARNQESGIRNQESGARSQESNNPSF